MKCFLDSFLRWPGMIIFSFIVHTYVHFLADRFLLRGYMFRKLVLSMWHVYFLVQYLHFSRRDVPNVGNTTRVLTLTTWFVPGSPHRIPITWNIWTKKEKWFILPNCCLYGIQWRFYFNQLHLFKKIWFLEWRTIFDYIYQIIWSLFARVGRDDRTWRCSDLQEIIKSEIIKLAVLLKWHSEKLTWYVKWSHNCT